MAHIKEPKGVDFIINSRPLTSEEETAISAYIKNYKSKNSKAANKTKQATKKRTSTLA